MDSPTDCLVLRIKEIEKDSLMRDNTMFILYDTQLEKYIIRGKRNDCHKFHFFPYSFSCKNKKDVYEFICFSTCCSNNLSIDLLNYDNLPYDSNDITYDFLEKYVSRSYEISGYDNLIIGSCKNNNKDKDMDMDKDNFNCMSKKNIIRLLSLLKNITNEYF